MAPGDTVFDRDNSGRPPAERNGYVFHRTGNLAVESALSRALRLWFARPREFRNLAATCMHADYSWRQPGQDYLDIYSRVQHR
jgi:starch synthase